MSEIKEAKKQPSVIKSVIIVILLFLGINFLFELLIQLIEAKLPVSLYEIFPFTRIAILVAVIYGYRSYVNKKYDKEPKKPSKVFLVLGCLAIATLLLVGVLTGVRGYASPEAIKTSYDAITYLEKSTDTYAKCYNSINYQGLNLTNITLSYVRADFSEENRAKAKATEEAFKQKINEQCQKPVADYETNFATLVKNYDEVSMARRSLLSKILGAKPEAAEVSYKYLSPQSVRISKGLSFSDVIYTQEEVESFYKSQMGY